MIQQKNIQQKLNNAVKNSFRKKKLWKNGKSILIIMMHLLIRILLFIQLIKPDIAVRLLTTGCLSRIIQIIGSICAPLTWNLPNIIKDTPHLLDLTDDISKTNLLDKLILALFNIDKMFPNTDNERGIETACSLDSSYSKNPSTECIMKVLEICFLNNKSRFGNIYLL